MEEYKRMKEECEQIEARRKQLIAEMEKDRVQREVGNKYRFMKSYKKNSCPGLRLEIYVLILSVLIVNKHEIVVTVQFTAFFLHPTFLSPIS